MVRELVSQLLRVVVPEQLFMNPTCLPQDMLQEYLQQKEHFSMRALVQQIVDGKLRKHIVYTRTSAQVLALQPEPVYGQDLLDSVVLIADARASVGRGAHDLPEYCRSASSDVDLRRWHAD